MDRYSTVKRSIKQGMFNYCENLLKNEDVFYHSAPCLGVKFCPQKDCKYIIPIHDIRVYPEHSKPLEKSFNCPVEFVYIGQKANTDNRRWIAF